MRKLISLLLCLSLIIVAFAVGHAEGDKITITMMDYFTQENASNGDAEAIMYRMIVDKWLENHPNVELIEESVAHDVYETKIKTLAAANELPDIFMALPTYMKSFYNNEQILDLRPIIEADEEWNARFPEGAMGDFEYGDVILGASRVGIYNSLILYNSEILAEVGYDAFPATLEDFVECVKALKAAGYIPMACGNKGPYDLSSQKMPGLLFKYCSAEWYAGVRNGDGAAFTDPDPVAAITCLKDLIDLGIFNEDMNAIDQEQARQMFYDGKAAMVSEGSWIIKEFISETTDEVMDRTEFAIFPPLADKPENADQIVGGQGWGPCLNRNLEGEQYDLCVDFIKTISDPEIQAYAVEGGMFAVTKDAPYDESKLHPLYLKALNVISQYGTVVGCPEVQLSAEYMDASYVGYQELSIGSVTPEELAETLQDAHESAE